MTNLDFDNLPPVRIFGEWDAPVTDGGECIDVPTHLSCMNCHFPFEEGDNGAIMPSGYAQHRECALRAVWGGIGHVVDHAHYCGGELGPDAGLSFRQSALLVWDVYSHKREVTVEELETMRPIG